MADDTQTQSDGGSTDRLHTTLRDHPQQIGPYHILGLIGEGGMGEVFKAERRSPMRQTVAIKIIKLGFNSREVIARFESERQALARMDHPNVARVLDAGTTDAGRPYFVMEYVPGDPITKFADDNKLSIKDRLLLFTQACDAISHAHTKAIIHRDIKASNVLAFMHDGKPLVKVIDFGIAKALTGDRLTDRTFYTDRGQIIGTYDSMSPEQAEGSQDIDTRTDVYSLGVLLYELLAGAPPFDHATLAHAADEEVRRIIREVEPPRPSTRLTSLGETATKIAAARQSKLEALAKELRTELEWIPLKAMRKERARRYASPLQLAEDVENYLEQRPLLAAPESRIYRLRKFVRRRRGSIVTTCAIGLATVAISLVYANGVAVQRAASREIEVQSKLDLALRAERHAKDRANLAQARLWAALALNWSLAHDVLLPLGNDPVSGPSLRKSLNDYSQRLGDAKSRTFLGTAVDASRAAALARAALADIFYELGDSNRAVTELRGAVSLYRTDVADGPERGELLLLWLPRVLKLEREVD
ncbi:MAG: serine/threonine protein kinase, partial [Tepidisphaeraceae bacterium]